MAPRPPTLGAPRGNPWRSSILRAKLRDIQAGGPEMAPRPTTLGAPRGTRGAPRFSALSSGTFKLGAPKWPPDPQRSERPGEPVALLDSPAGRRSDGAREAHRQQGRRRPRAPRSVRQAGGPPWSDQRSFHGRAAQPRPGPALERDQRVSPQGERRRTGARRARRLRDGPGKGLRIHLERARAPGPKSRRARGHDRRGP